MPGKLTYADIVTRLNTELVELKAANIVLESGHDDDDLRLDGHLKNDAKPPRFPGVVLRLYAGLTPAPTGAFVFASNTYDDWQGNLWAVAQTLERLRTLVSYGTVRAADLYTLFRDTSPDAVPMPEPKPDDGTKSRRPTPKSRPRPASVSSTAAPIWNDGKQNAARLLLREAGEDDHFRFASLLLKKPVMARRVFIAATKNAHPDGGGSDERMRGVSEAWGMLNP